MDANKVIADMREIIDQPGYPYLVSHREDFDVIDVQSLRANFSTGARYLWVVKQCGTHLTRLGVHPRADSWARANINSGITSSELGAQIYLLSDEGVKLISCEEAETEIQRMDYTTVGKVIRRSSGEAIATINIASSGYDDRGNRFYNMLLQSESPDSLNRADLTALGAIAVCEAEQHAQTFFVRVDSILLNGKDITTHLAS